MRRRLAISALAAALAVTSAVAVADALGSPLGGFRYVGVVKQGGYHSIVFDVSRSGKRVQHLKTVGLPSFCGSSSLSTVRYKAVRIKGNSFTSTAKQVVGGKLVAKATVKGRFSSRTGAKGTVKVAYPGESKCSGTAHFTAIAGGLP